MLRLLKFLIQIHSTERLRCRVHNTMYFFVGSHKPFLCVVNHIDNLIHFFLNRQITLLPFQKIFIDLLSCAVSRASCTSDSASSLMRWHSSCVSFFFLSHLLHRLRQYLIRPNLRIKRTSFRILSYLSMYF